MTWSLLLLLFLHGIARAAASVPEPRKSFAEDQESFEEINNLGEQDTGEAQSEYALMSQDDVRDIHFYIFSQPGARNLYTELLYDDLKVDPAWDPTLPTKVLVHGFVQNLDASFPQNVKNAYLQRMERKGRRLYNIIVVDWGRLAYENQFGLHYYRKAVLNVPKVGQRIANLISAMLEKNLITSLKKVHLIGQSLGAHIVGEAGNRVKTLQGGRTVGRISALDPAGPNYRIALFGIGRHIATGDADFMDAYHCNPGAFGTTKSVGDVEFWINHQWLTNVQPQCRSKLIGLNVLRNIEAAALCSHDYCPKFFALSVLEERDAYQCKGLIKSWLKFGCNTAVFGEDVEFTSRGEFDIDIGDNLSDSFPVDRKQ